VPSRETDRWSAGRTEDVQVMHGHRGWYTQPHRCRSYLGMEGVRTKRTRHDREQRQPNVVSRFRGGTDRHDPRSELAETRGRRFEGNTDYLNVRECRRRREEVMHGCGKAAVRRVVWQKVEEEPGTSHGSPAPGDRRAERRSEGNDAPNGPAIDGRRRAQWRHDGIVPAVSRPRDAAAAPGMHSG